MKCGIVKLSTVQREGTLLPAHYLSDDEERAAVDRARARVNAARRAETRARRALAVRRENLARLSSEVVKP